MRLICPNCDAQYEVDAAMIPASGRDVQCSNCGRTWFQEAQGAESTVLAEGDELAAEEAQAFERSGDGLDERAKAFFERREFDDLEPEDDAVSAEAAADSDADGWDEEADAGDDLDDTGAPEPEGEEPDETFEEERAAATDADDAPDESSDVPPPEDLTIAADAAEDGYDDEDFDDEAPESSYAVELPRRKPDAHVLGILRAEAEREIAARRAEEAEAMESQPDLGALDPAPPRPAPAETEARTARLRGAETPEEETAQRKSMLPDIDDINATLTATRDRRTPEMPELSLDDIARRRTGFRIGFSSVMAVAVLLILAYLYAPQIARAVPGLEGAMATYVDWANGMRLSLDAVLANTVDRITGVAETADSDG